MTSDQAQAVEAWQDNQRLRDELAASEARVRELTEALTEAGLALAEASVDLDQAGKQVAASDAHQAQKSIVAVLNSEEPNEK